MEGGDLVLRRALIPTPPLERDTPFGQFPHLKPAYLGNMAPILKSKSARRRVAVLITAIASLVALAAFTAKPAYRLLREWRVDRMIQQSDEALQRGNLVESRRLALAALNIRKNDYQTLKLLSRSMTALNDSRTGSLTMALMSHPDTTEEDRLLSFKTACEELPLGWVLTLRANLGKEKADSPEYLVLFVERVIDQGNLRLAQELLMSRSDSYLDNALRIQTARLMIQKGTHESLDAAQLTISDLIFNDAPERLEAFRLLADIAPENFRSGLFPELSLWIENLAEATTSDKLLARIQQIQRRPGARDQIIAEAIASYTQDDLAAVTSWLLSLGEAEKALELIPEEDSSSDFDLFRQRAKALAALGRWREATEWLSTPPAQFPKLELHCLRVLSSNNPSRRTREWTLALEEASLEENRNAFLDLYEWMREAGELNYTREAMVEAVKLGRGRLPDWAILRVLVPWLRTKSDPESQFRFFTSMAEIEPGNLVVSLEYADIACLLGKTEPWVRKKLIEMGQLEPDLQSSDRYLEVLATTYLLNDQPQEALATLDRIQGSGPAYGRIEAIRRISNLQLLDDPSTAPPITLDWDRLLNSEKQALRAHLARITKKPIGEELATLPDPAAPLPELLPLPEDKSLPKLLPLPENKPLPKLLPLPEDKPLPALPPLPKPNDQDQD